MGDLLQLGAVLQREVLLYTAVYGDDGAKTYSPLAARHEAAPRYRPESDEVAFQLIAVNAPKTCGERRFGATSGQVRDAADVWVLTGKDGALYLMNGDRDLPTRRHAQASRPAS